MSLESLNDDRVEQALKYLAKTDEPHAILSGQVKELEELLKHIKATEFLKASGTVGEREATALASVKYNLAVKEWATKWTEFKTMDNKRQHEVRILEIWQTFSANRRKGSL